MNVAMPLPKPPICLTASSRSVPAGRPRAVSCKRTSSFNSVLDTPTTHWLKLWPHLLNEWKSNRCIGAIAASSSERSKRCSLLHVLLIARVCGPEWRHQSFAERASDANWNQRRLSGDTTQGEGSKHRSRRYARACDGRSQVRSRPGFAAGPPPARRPSCAARAEPAAQRAGGQSWLAIPRGR